MTERTEIFIAGHNGMVGSAIYRKLLKEPNNEIIVMEREDLDCTSQKEVDTFFECHKIDQVYLAAAKVGGVYANNAFPADFIYENLMIESNIIHASHSNKVNKLLFLGSSCIYPVNSEQPMKEEQLLTGCLESTNEPYAIAKIAGIKLCESYNRQHQRDYRSVMPTNLFGQNDNFHKENSHVIPALIRRFHEAKLNQDDEVVVWGTGSPKREFMHVDDVADAAIYIMNLGYAKYHDTVKPMLSHINVGTRVECTIKQLADTVAEVVGYQGEIKWDRTKPDGAPRKLLDTSRLKNLGWESKVSLETGLTSTYDWFLDNIDNFRK